MTNFNPWNVGRYYVDRALLGDWIVIDRNAMTPHSRYISREKARVAALLLNGDSADVDVRSRTIGAVADAEAKPLESD